MLLIGKRYKVDNLSVCDDQVMLSKTDHELFIVYFFAY